MKERGGEGDLLPHPAGVAGEEVALPVVETEELEQGVDPPIAQPPLDVVEVARKLEELAGTELVVEGGRIGDVPDPGLGLLGFRQDVEAGDPGRS